MVAALIGIALVIALAIGIIYAVVSARSGATTGSARGSAGAERTSALPTPQVSDFHVAGDTATTRFDVPLGDSEAGQHLVDILSLAAVEHLHAKQKSGLPLDGVTRIDVHAIRNGASESITVVELPNPGELPSAEAMRVALAPAHDPIADLAAVVADTSVSAPPSSKGQLESVAEFVRLSGPTEATLRSMGVDPASMSLSELAKALFAAGGFSVQEGHPSVKISSEPTAEVYRFTKAGQDAAAVVLAHEVGSHPEVPERLFTEIAVASGQLGSSQILLITDKFGPYSMYEREKRSKNTVFITRERLQAFVDTFGLS